MRIFTTLFFALCSFYALRAQNCPISVNTNGGYYLAFTTDDFLGNGGTCIYPDNTQVVHNGSIITSVTRGQCNNNTVAYSPTGGVPVNPPFTIQFYTKTCFFGANGFSILPVELSQFEVTQTPASQDITLNWATASEENSDFFSIEYSYESADKWETVGSVKSKNALDGYDAYAWKLPNPLAGAHYFRLKMVDLDGTYEYSDVVSTTVEGGKSSFQLVPTLVHNHAQLLGDWDQITDLAVFSQHGQLMTQTDNPTAVLAALANLPKGYYHLQIVSGRSAEVIAFAKL